MATIADVARRARVSIATVSRVLSPGPVPHPVHPETAARVRAAAAALDYIPSALARGLASRRSGLLGFLVPSLADPHYPQIARGAEDGARLAGLSLLVCNTLGDPDRAAAYLRLLRSRHVDALIVSGGSTLTSVTLAAITDSHLPAVLIGRPASDQAMAYVCVDNRAAARQATLHLLATGRTRVVHLAGPRAQTTMADRAVGYSQTLAERGLSAALVETDGSADGALAATRALLEKPARVRPDAIFAAADRMAVAAMAAASDAGVAVPRDLAVMGFDDLALDAYLRPSLSSVAQPARELGEAAIRLALRLVAGESVRPIVLQARPVLRQSTAGTASLRAGTG